ncbi:receptor-type tyrosine-protein phosphatase kappa-like isoform X1 [Ostrea edulis]|uniref:receptor-type tyrosine-protein phosphatase kappa-like isoform X1 n=1 Tax=Ostrea edulis TaxID=37623 RepID=UPI0024AEC4DC|nr:receptor-type tyrosine-protein phosphatase kappa-like isoform X1 [Ostrea edulis]XP_056003187.1 receptor-type tyrosine-protein phosphatase kappa-like isoform X1 [Ostrea edulis]
MAVLRWTCVILSLGFIYCYDNLSRRRTTTLSQSSTHGDQYASYANDTDLRTNYGRCAHTAAGQLIAWFQVDLGKEYSIKSVKIYYRRDGERPGDWKQYRFKQFYLDVSNSPAAVTTTSERTRCYTDTSPDLPDNIIDIPCKQTARYVIVETTYDTPEDGATTGAILEICEIQVFGCEIGKYGDLCWDCSGCQTCDVISGVCPSITCGANCMNGLCDSTTGYCTQGCTNGYWGYGCTSSPCGYTCTSTCPPNCQGGNCNMINGNCNGCSNDNYWGQTCNNRCSGNCNGSVCVQNTGYCSNGCSPGRYGNNCEHNCNEKCLWDTCRQDVGVCTNGCIDSYYGYKCEYECSTHCSQGNCDRYNGTCSGCSSGYFGSSCRDTCSVNCAEGTCDQQTGKCHGGCKPNWTGNQCDRCDSTHYGLGCSQECNVNCKDRICNSGNGFCTSGCKIGFYGNTCSDACSSSCPSGCNRYSGDCEGTCPNDKYGKQCDLPCSPGCTGGCNKDTGVCDSGCVVGKFGTNCSENCNTGCIADCGQNDGRCKCKMGWQGDKCDKCKSDYYGHSCDQQCSSHCVNGSCFTNNGTCVGGCTGEFSDDKCTQALLRSEPASFPITEVGAGLGAVLFVLLAIVIAVILLRSRRQKHANSLESAVSYHNGEPFSSTENKLYTNIGNVSVSLEDPDEEPQIEKPEESVYYNDLSVTKDIAVTDLLKIITAREAKENEGFLKEYKSLPYGERFDCRTAKLEENMPKNRFKTTFPYDHSRVVLEVDEGFTSDYINANFIENMDGKREYIASQGPRPNTLVDHWRIIWQEHVQYIVMLTNLIEGPKIKCHQYWPDEEKELDVNPFSVTLLEEKVYAYYVVRRMTVRKKGSTGSRTVVQFHYTRWPDHGTPNPLNLLVFHRHFRHKINMSQHPILVHCSAGIGRTGTFIALDVLSRHGERKSKINVIEFVKAMRKDRMTMIQNVDQYIFLYHALYEFFRRKTRFTCITKVEFVKRFGEMNKIETKKQLSDEFNELTSLKPKYSANDFKSGKEHSKLNAAKSVLPVDKYLVYLTSNVKGRDSYYNAVNVSSFTRAEEFISVQHPVHGAAIDLVRLLIDQESHFLISLTPLSDVDELKDWVKEEIQNIKLEPYEITKHSQTILSECIRKTSIGIKKKEGNKTQSVQIFECLTWRPNDILPAETSSLTDLVKQFSLDRKSEPKGRVTVMSKDGATSCGIFCAVYNAIEQLQQDDEVDLFTIVQQLQCRRPEMISKKEEYDFCFKAVGDYMNSDSVYANT